MIVLKLEILAICALHFDDLVPFSVSSLHKRKNFSGRKVSAKYFGDTVFGQLSAVWGNGTTSESFFNSEGSTLLGNKKMFVAIMMKHYFEACENNNTLISNVVRHQKRIFYSTVKLI